MPAPESLERGDRVCDGGHLGNCGPTTSDVQTSWFGHKTNARLAPYCLPPMATLLGVDVGGTFTDLVWCDDVTGEVVVGKEPTWPDAPERGVVGAVEAALSPDRVAGSSLFLHGTTVGLNALLERRGATVGLIATRGFRDVLEVRRGDRDDPYDLFWKAPAPLVPRHLRATVAERVLAGRHGPRADRPDQPGRDGRRVRRRRRRCGRRRAAQRLRERRPRDRRRARAAPPRLRGRDLALAPDLGRVPRVRAHLHDGDRCLRAASHGPVPRAPARGARRVRVRRRVADHALGRRRDDVRAGDRAAVRDGHLRPRRRRGRDGRARAPARAHERDRGRRRRHQLRHLPDHGRPGAGPLPGPRRRSADPDALGRRPLDRRGRAARSRTSARAACCTSGRRAPGRFPDPPATGAAAASRR